MEASYNMEAQRRGPFISAVTDFAGDTQVANVIHRKSYSNSLALYVAFRLG